LFCHCALKNIYLEQISSISQVPEILVIAAKATIMLYDDATKRWLPGGSANPGISRIQIFQNVSTNTYRIIGRKISDQEV
jgi:hypothetical protein